MSRKGLVLVLALIGVVSLWPVAGAVTATDSIGNGGVLAGLSPGSGVSDAQSDAPGQSIAQQKRSEAGTYGDRLAVGVTDGTLGPNETVTIEVTQGNQTVENATVYVNEKTVGTTSADGTFALVLPDSEEVKIEVEHDNAETEVEVEFEHEDDEAYETDGEPVTVDVVDGTLGPGETATVELSQGNGTVENATVYVNEEAVGTTSADGTLTITLPEDDEINVEIEHGDVETELEFDIGGGEQAAHGQPLTVGIVDGTLGPAETVTIEVSQGNGTVENATVELNEELVGATDANGTLTFSLPDDHKTKIKIEHGDAETELEFEFEGGDEKENENEEDEEDEDEEDDEDDGEEEEDEEDEEDENDEDEPRDGEDHPGGGKGPF